MSLHEAFDPYCTHDRNNKILFQGTLCDFLYNAALAGWEKFHNGEFGDFCSSVRMSILTVTRRWEKRNVQRFLEVIGGMS